MGIRFYNLNGFFVKKLAHGVDYQLIPQEDSPKLLCRASGKNVGGYFSNFHNLAVNHAKVPPFVKSKIPH